MIVSELASEIVEEEEEEEEVEEEKSGTVRRYKSIESIFSVSSTCSNFGAIDQRTEILILLFVEDLFLNQKRNRNVVIA